LRTWIGLMLITGCALSALPAYAATALYVAANGDDAWTGKLPAPNPGKTDGPFASLARARDEVRRLRAANAVPDGVTVAIRGGAYYLPEPLAFDLQDSGSAGSPTVFAAYNGERVVISGGRPVTGLTEGRVAGQRAWQASLPATKSGAWCFRQLFAQRQGEGYYTRRFRPMRGMMVVADLTYSPERKTMFHRAAQQDFIFHPGDLKPWQNLDDVEVVALHSWSASRLKIQKLDLDTRTVTFTSVPTFRIGAWYKDERNPYYVENVREELKEPGQWYLDRPTGTLTYLPLPGETRANVALIAPMLERLITIQGDLKQGQLVENLRFQGLTFCHTEWPVPDQGYDVSQGQPTLPAAIELTAAKQCGFERCVVTDTGAYGIGLGLGCQECSVTGCYLYDLGGGGVRVGDCSMDQNAEFPVLPIGNTVENSTITSTGIIHYSANGIWCGIVKGTRICHNEISHNPYTGIAVGWCWGPQPTSCGENLIECNHVHDVMELVQDGGGIYTLGRQPGTVIRGNLVHDNHMSPFACANGQTGLYFDQGSSGFLVENNIQYVVEYEPDRINQDVNDGPPHTIRNNYLGIRPDDPQFPKQLAAQAGMGAAYRGVVYPVRLTPNPVYAMPMPKVEPSPVGLDLTFENIPVGRAPHHLSLALPPDKAAIAVTDEAAASGSHSLKFQDAKGLAKTFYPYACYGGYEIARGEVTVSFYVKQAADKPGKFAVDLRDYVTQQVGEFASGPSFELMGDGKLMVAGKEVATLPVGEWSHLEVQFALGEGAPKAYQLSVVLPDSTTRTVKLPFVSEQFAAMTALYFVADDDKDAATYLDNLRLSVK